MATPLAALTPLMPAIIRFSHVTVSVPDKTLLHDVSFTVNSGDKAVLCGKSGSGKSTVLKTLLGLLPVQEGVIEFQGQPLNVATLALIRHHTAYIGQEPVLGAETVHEALLLPFRFKAHRDAMPSTARLEEVLARLGLSSALLAQDCARVSGGEKQRLALARGLLLGKSVYLLDEVTSALDEDSKQAVFAVFADPALTVLSVAHDPDWLACCTKMWSMADGRLSEVSHEYA